MSYKTDNILEDQLEVLQKIDNDIRDQLKVLQKIDSNLRVLMITVGVLTGVLIAYLASHL